MVKASFLLVAVAGSMLCGCGTIDTVFRGDYVAGNNLKEWKTNCDYIPRIYSGISYDFCVLNGFPDSSEVSSAINLQLIDFIPSGILDTLVLPYTFYRQHLDGNIEIPK